MTVRLWDIQTGVVQSVLEPGPQWTFTLVFPPDSQVVAIPMKDGIAWWDLDTGIRRQTLGMRQPLGLFAFSPNTKLLAVIVNSGTQYFSSIWDLTVCRFIHRLQSYEHTAVAIAFSPKTQFLAVAS